MALFDINHSCRSCAEPSVMHENALGYEVPRQRTRTACGNVRPVLRIEEPFDITIRVRTSSKSGGLLCWVHLP